MFPTRASLYRPFTSLASHSSNGMSMKTCPSRYFMSISSKGKAWRNNIDRGIIKGVEQDDGSAIDQGFYAARVITGRRNDLNKSTLWQ